MKKMFLLIAIIFSFANQQIILANEKAPNTIESTIYNYKNGVDGIEKPISIEHIMFPAKINDKSYLLEAVIYRPLDDKQHPVMIFTHGRMGSYPPKNPKGYFDYNQVTVSGFRSTNLL